MPRVEHDYLGERQLADDCYYGIQTLRGVEASGITGRSLVSYAPRLLYYMAAIKWAAAKANLESGRISEEQSDAHQFCSQRSNGWKMGRPVPDRQFYRRRWCIDPHEYQ